MDKNDYVKRQQLYKERDSGTKKKQEIIDKEIQEGFGQKEEQKLNTTLYKA